MGELEYIDNYDYGRDTEPTTEALLEELAEVVGRDEYASELYEAIYSRALHDIRTSDLAITRIMPDLLEMICHNQRKAMLVMRLLADPYASYSELGSIMGYSKQRVHVVLHELSTRYDWLERLLEIRND
jgi:hypothetical protein